MILLMVLREEGGIVGPGKKGSVVGPGKKGSVVGPGKKGRWGGREGARRVRHGWRCKSVTRAQKRRLSHSCPNSKTSAFFSRCLRHSQAKDEDVGGSRSAKGGGCLGVGAAETTEEEKRMARDSGQQLFASAMDKQLQLSRSAHADIAHARPGTRRRPSRPAQAPGCDSGSHRAKHHQARLQGGMAGRLAQQNIGCNLLQSRMESASAACGTVAAGPCRLVAAPRDVTKQCPTGVTIQLHPQVRSTCSFMAGTNMRRQSARSSFGDCLLQARATSSHSTGS